jgi:hypothetical protein
MSPIPEVCVRPLPEPLAKRAALELNERPEHIARDLANIKQWLLKSPHITARMDDQFLIGFLRGCKYRMERVKEKLEMFYTVRTALPKVMSNQIVVKVNIADTLTPLGDRKARSIGRKSSRDSAQIPTTAFPTENHNP